MKRGRPPFQKGESKSLVLNVRLKPDEMAQLQVGAGKAGQDVSDFARDRLFAKPQPAPNPPTILDWRSVGIYVMTPNPIDQAHWDQLRRYVCEVIKPATAQSTTTQENPNEEETTER